MGRFHVAWCKTRVILRFVHRLGVRDFWIGSRPCPTPDVGGATRRDQITMCEQVDHRTSKCVRVALALFLGESSIGRQNAIEGLRPRVILARAHFGRKEMLVAIESGQLCGLPRPDSQFADQVIR
jgi:hypothetical protein